MKKALTFLTKKHGILRTTFNVVEGELCQCVSDEVLFNFHYDDILSLPEYERDEWVENVARQEGQRLFHYLHVDVMLDAASDGIRI
ncbi:hypothetical protein, partial [Serratia marcescens]|uniref:hypothetical protein n=1 Tax=Serratia marcescens TaxID=615 RepID=UPI001BCFF6B0